MSSPTGRRADARRLRRATRLAEVRWGGFALSVALGSVAVLAGVALAGVAGYLICRAAQQPPILSLTVLLVAVRALALGRPLARYGERLSSHDLAFRSLGRLRAVVFARIEPLAPAELDEFRDGDLLSRMVADIDELQDLVLRVLLPAAVAVVAGGTIVVGVLVVFPPAAFLLAVGLAVAATVPPAVARRLTERQSERQAAQRAHLTDDLVETLGAADELWLYGADDAARRSIAADDAALVEAAEADSRGAGWADGLGVIVSGLTTVAVLGAATAATGRGAVDPLLVAPLVLISMAAFEAVLPLGASARHLASVLAASDRVRELLEREPGVHDPAVPVEPPGRRPRIDLRSVTIERGRAGGRAVAVDGVDLRVEPGERVVVTGPSGAGKSTLLQLVVRFLERERGEARLAEHDLRAYAQDDVRQQVLWLAQDAHVFNSNLRENVALARPGATDDQIVEALTRAQLGTWLDELPHGLDTLVGEQGRSMSGGQRQRLAMARAFLADPSVLLLDEPTAHLDSTTAAALLDDLWSFAGDRSVVLVSHGSPGPFGTCRDRDLATSRRRRSCGRSSARLTDRWPRRSAGRPQPMPVPVAAATASSTVSKKSSSPMVCVTP